MTFPVGRRERRLIRDRRRRHTRRLGVVGLITEFHDRLLRVRELADRLLMLPEETDYSELRALNDRDLSALRAELEELAMCVGWFDLEDCVRCFGGQVARKRGRAQALLAALPPATR